MKNIKKFKLFENNESRFQEIISSCKMEFGEFIDDGADLEINIEDKSIDITILSPEVENQDFWVDIREFYDYNKKLMEFIEDIMSPVKRLFDKYGTTIIDIEITKSSIKNTKYDTYEASSKKDNIYYCVSVMYVAYYF